MSKFKPRDKVEARWQETVAAEAARKNYAYPWNILAQRPSISSNTQTPTEARPEVREVLGERDLNSLLDYSPIHQKPKPGGFLNSQPSWTSAQEGLCELASVEWASPSFEEECQSRLGSYRSNVKNLSAALDDFMSGVSQIKSELETISHSSKP
jgi:hypothetical protein